MKFIPLAEEAGLMWPLDHVGLKRGARAVRRRGVRRAGNWLCRSTLPPANLLDAELPGSREDPRSNDTSCPARPSSSRSPRRRIITDFLRRRPSSELRDLGIVVSIDDFGAGFTSLAYLSKSRGRRAQARPHLHHRVNPKEMDARWNSSAPRSISATTWDFASSPKVSRTSRHSTSLDDLGCDLAQGYFISRPSPASRLSFQSSDIRSLPETTSV